MNLKTETFITVQFYDLDPMNVVWHGNYIKYIETARCDLLSKIGYDYDSMREENIAYPVAKMDLKFMKSGSFNQKLKVSSTIEEIEPCLIIKYLITDAESGERLLKATTMQICVNMVTGESIYSAPKRLKEKLACCTL